MNMRAETRKDKVRIYANADGMKTPSDRNFGPYLLHREGNHLTIIRKDGLPVEPTFYEMQHMKCLMFGGCGVAVEIFPTMRDMFDGQNQRHLWKIDHKTYLKLPGQTDHPQNKMKR